MNLNFCRQTSALLALAIIMTFSPLAAGIKTHLNENNDHGLWLEQNFLKKLPCNWSLNIHTEERWGADDRKFYYAAAQAILLYELTPLLCLEKGGLVDSLSIGPGYNNTDFYSKNLSGNYHWTNVYKTLLEGNWGAILWKWKIAQRLRGEYHQHHRKNYKNFPMGRYRVVVTGPWKFTPWQFTPYISNEILFRQSSYNKTTNRGLVGGIWQNRFRLGLDFQPWSEMQSASFYWQWLARKQKPGSAMSWHNNYIIGFVVNFEL